MLNLINMTDNVHEAIQTYSMNAIYNQWNYLLPFKCQKVFYEYWDNLRWKTVNAQVFCRPYYKLLWFTKILHPYVWKLN